MNNEGNNSSEQIEETINGGVDLPKLNNEENKLETLSAEDSNVAPSDVVSTPEVVPSVDSNVTPEVVVPIPGVVNNVDSSGAQSVVAETVTENSANNPNNNKSSDVETHSFSEFFKDFYKYIKTRNKSDLKDLVSKMFLIALALIIIVGTITWYLVSIIPDILLALNISYNSANNTSYVITAIDSIVGLYFYLKVTKDRFYTLVKNQKDIEELKKQ